MVVFRCARFPQGLAKIRTTEGIVEFRDGAAEVDDERLAAALREVPEVFGITETGARPAATQRPVRPALNASKDAWVTYALATVAITEQQARGMTKDQLIELAR
ncbi:MAG: hypothetical protein ACRDQH_18215 [Pseudonocardiaceae bacterium]